MFGLGCPSGRTFGSPSGPAAPLPTKPFLKSPHTHPLLTTAFHVPVPASSHAVVSRVPCSAYTPFSVHAHSTPTIPAFSGEPPAILKHLGDCHFLSPVSRLDKWDLAGCTRLPNPAAPGGDRESSLHLSASGEEGHDYTPETENYHYCVLLFGSVLQMGS